MVAMRKRYGVVQTRIVRETLDELHTAIAEAERAVKFTPGIWSITRGGGFVQYVVRGVVYKRTNSRNCGKQMRAFIKRHASTNEWTREQLRGFVNDGEVHVDHLVEWLLRK